MIRAVWPEKSTWNDLPWKFEAGTPNVEGAVGLGAAIDYLHGLEFRHIEAWEEELGKYALQRLYGAPGVKLYGHGTTAPSGTPHGAPGVTLYGSAAHRGSAFSFTLGNIHAHDVAQFLDREGIAVRAGHHCAQPLMRKLGVPATVRASLSFYNTFAEIDRLAEALEGALRFYA